MRNAEWDELSEFSCVIVWDELKELSCVKWVESKRMPEVPIARRSSSRSNTCCCLQKVQLSRLPHESNSSSSQCRACYTKAAPPNATRKQLLSELSCVRWVEWDELCELSCERWVVRDELCKLWEERSCVRWVVCVVWDNLGEVEWEEEQRRRRRRRRHGIQA